MEKSHFSGRMRKRSFEIGVAPVVSSSDGEGVSYTSSFDSEAVKRPLLDLLRQAGWTQHSGFLGRLFGD